MAFIQVAVPVPLRQLFTYVHSEALAAGVRVLVPFGPRKLVGVVVDGCFEIAGDNEAADISKIKPIEQTIDEQPVLDVVLLKI